MSLYKEEKIVGEITKYSRVGSFAGYNTYNDIPSIVFNEELNTIFPDGSNRITDGIGRLTALLTDPMKPLVLLNPLDDSVLDDATIMAVARTYGMAQIVLYSLYRAKASERDALAAVGSAAEG